MTLVGFEPTTLRLEVARAIQLRHRAYFCITKSTEIDPLPPTGFEPVTYRLQSDCAKPLHQGGMWISPHPILYKDL